MSSSKPVIPEKTSRFTESIGLVFDNITATLVRGHAELNEEHHTPWGVVHGGVYTSMIESAGSVGASYAVAERNQFAVGVHNATDFLRPSTGASVLVAAKALFQGRTQQLWEVIITDKASGKELSRGQLRTQNVDMPSA